MEGRSEAFQGRFLAFWLHVGEGAAPRPWSASSTVPSGHRRAADRLLSVGDPTARVRGDRPVPRTRRAGVGRERPGPAPHSKPTPQTPADERDQCPAHRKGVLDPMKRGAEHPSRPCALFVTGAPGSGKTTFGRLLAQELGATLLDLDTATERLIDVLATVRGGANLDDPEFARETRAARYDTICSLAVDNVAVGLDVVLTAPFTEEVRDAAKWDQSARRMVLAGATPFMVWIELPGHEVLRRVRDRDAARDASKLGESWLAGLDLSPPVAPHIAVSGMQPPEQMLAAVMAELRSSAGGAVGTRAPSSHDHPERDRHS
ncbi:AAA family ATPase [Oryzobacter telluris]|uniref:AAA family ATPase n=1 Tax=Oryzobacter telluris TaxID=3149179 RepID=UPI00370D12AB